MEIHVLHFEDLGVVSVVLGVNAVVLVLGGYQNSNVPQGGIYPRIKFERDPLNICRVCSHHQGLRADAAAMIKP